MSGFVTLGVMVRLYVCSPTMTTEMEGLLQTREGREAIRCHEENLHVGLPTLGGISCPAQCDSKGGSHQASLDQPCAEWAAVVAGMVAMPFAVPCSSSSRRPTAAVSRIPQAWQRWPQCALTGTVGC